ncbi:hypothetical protein VTL71DRAFT_8606 [Oculimacula yallundae]|uniref:Enoyl reductase (ER) domain-containing protein n=1 Tax=Oculimacula yallundae TaxID=86028 RepID=A0ABR4CY83_9HELO
MASTMKAWQYSSQKGALEEKLTLATEATRPTLNATKPQMLVEVISMGLNPADYKVAEMTILGNIAISKPASPGMDFSGRVVTLGQATDLFKVGDVVVGRVNPTQFGALGQFVVASYDGCAILPKGVDPDHAAGIGTAGQTAYQTIAPNVKEGDKIFINGGSGAVGAFGIQIAKAIGCHVTVSCSTSKIDWCKQNGADEIIDYTSADVTQKLIENGQIYSLVVDNVGNSPVDLYTKADKFLLPAGKFVQVGGSASLESAKIMASRMLLPGILGGGKRKFVMYSTKNSSDDIARIVEWVAEGKVKVPMEEVFEYEDALKAIALLKKGKSKGKIIVHVGQKA